MTSVAGSLLTAFCTMLLLILSGTAVGHEAHRKPTSVADEATAERPATHRAAVEIHDEQLPHDEKETFEATSAVPHAHSNHEPSAHGAAPEPVSILDWLGRFHPMVIHFPIALFLAAIIAELLFALTQGEMFRHALRFTLWGGAMSTAIAAPLGWMFAASGATEEGWILEAHRWSGTAALILGLAVLWIGEHTEREDGSRLLLRASLSIQALLIGSVGFFGGSLLYGFDHLWRGF